MSRLRADIWCAAFLRTHNDLGNMCVVETKGDPTAGQIWVVVDHLSGEFSLYTPAPFGDEPITGQKFIRRFDHVHESELRDRIARELKFDPDLWVIELCLRSGDPGLDLQG